MSIRVKIVCFGLLAAGIFGLSPTVYGDDIKKDVPVEVNVNEVITMVVTPGDEYNVDGQIEIDMDMNAYVEARLTVQAATNCFDGLSVVLNDVDENADLKHKENKGTIPTANGQPVAGTASWAFRIGESDDFLAIPKKSEAGIIILKTESPTENGIYEESMLTFAIATYVTQAPGAYTDSLAFTATVNAIHVPSNK